MACTTKANARSGAFRARSRALLRPEREWGLYKLEIPARIDAVGPLCAFLTVLAERHGLEPDDVHAVETATYEACLNIIEHAYRFERWERIGILLRFGSRMLVLAFRDRGKGFDPKSIPPTDVTDPLVRLHGRGFGMQMIRDAVDAVRYRRTGGGENVLLLVKNLSAPGDGREEDSLPWGPGGSAT